MIIYIYSVFIVIHIILLLLLLYIEFIRRSSSGISIYFLYVFISYCNLELRYLDLLLVLVIDCSHNSSSCCA